MPMQRVSWFSFFLVVLLCAFLVNASQEKGSSQTRVSDISGRRRASF
jgi:hypothetical protein